MNVSANKGTAFIIVLWLLAILGVLITTASMLSLAELRVTQAFDDAGAAAMMARSGLEAWVGQLSTEAETMDDEGVVITEIQPGHFVEMEEADDNRLENWHFEDWVADELEVWEAEQEWSNNWFPEEDIVKIGDRSVFVQGDGERELRQWPGPGLEEDEEYRIIVWAYDADGGAAVEFDLLHDVDDSFHSWLRSGELEVSETNEWVEIEYVDELGGDGESGDDGEFRFITHDPEESLYIGAIWLAHVDKEPPEDWPSLPGEDVEFVELYNTSPDTKNIVSDGYQLEDTLDTDGTPHDGDYGPYPFAVHPCDPGYPDDEDGALSQGQVGIVTDQNIDSRILGIDDDVADGEVRMYTLGEDGDQFLTGGIYDELYDGDDHEVLTFHRPGLEYDDLVIPADDDDNEWDLSADEEDAIFGEGHSLQKQDITGPDVNNNWDISDDPLGDPGDVAGAGMWSSNFHEDWAWDGEIFGGNSIGDTVYMPSLSGSPADNDVGYFRITRIEDESGKQDLRNPRPLDCDESVAGDTTSCVLGSYTQDEDKSGRTMYEEWAEKIYARDADEWVNTSDLYFLTKDVFDNNSEPVAVQRYRALRSSYSAFRTDEPQKVNINTATWEALRGIQVTDSNSSNGDTTMLSNDMAMDIIDERGANLSGELDSDDYDLFRNHHFPELSPEASGGGKPFESITDACDLLEDNYGDDFDCDVFSEYAMVESEGIMWIQIEGGSINGGQVRTSALVDRNPLIVGDPVQILYWTFREYDPGGDE